MHKIREWKQGKGMLPSLLLALLLVSSVQGRCPYSSSSSSSSSFSVDDLPSSSSHPSLTATDTRRRELFAASAAQLNYTAVKADIKTLLTKSQPFWPADFGNYGGLFIRLAWHSAGTYRRWDGRGGLDGARQRFEPERSWPDNTNLDKPKVLLQPLKLKYGDGISWGDLIMLAGTTAIESMGGPVLGFCAGRIDDWDGTASLELGPTPEQQLVAPCLKSTNCQYPLGPTELGLIYVNAEGPGGVPNPQASVPQIRSSFGRMGMNDSEAVALIGGGHTFGKMHGACTTGAGPSPKEDPSNPWPGTCAGGPLMGKGPYTYTAGFEGAWTASPTRWTNNYFLNLLFFNWTVGKGPGGKYQWKRSQSSGGDSGESTIRLAMLTTDVALLHDPAYLALVNKYLNISQAAAAFSHAWYKLMTADMGPRSRCLNADAPPAQPFQLPLPETPAHLANFARVKAEIRKYLHTNSSNSSGLLGDSDAGLPYYGALFSTLAWQCASTFRATDYKGGCNGARIRFPPQSTWPANKGLDKVLEVLGEIKAKFPDSKGALSWADLIVLAGTTAVEDATGSSLKFCGGRTDASDALSTEFLAPRHYATPIIEVLDNAKVMGLSAKEYVALQGGLRSPGHMQALGYSGSWNPLHPSELSNAYFTSLLTEAWALHNSTGNVTEYKAGDKDSYMTPQDLAIKWTPTYLAVAQAYAGDNALFLSTYRAAWTKMMNADRFKGPAGNVCGK